MMAQIGTNEKFAIEPIGKSVWLGIFDSEHLNCEFSRAPAVWNPDSELGVLSFLAADASTHRRQRNQSGISRFREENGYNSRRSTLKGANSQKLREVSSTQRVICSVNFDV